MTKAPKKINLDFRPATYFWPPNLETHLLSHVKGTQRRTALRAAIASNEFAQVFERIGDSELPDGMREAHFSIHPAFLGGEFLPARLTRPYFISTLSPPRRRRPWATGPML